MSWLKSFVRSFSGLEPDEIPHDALHNFTPRAQQVLTLAGQEANRLNHNFIGTEHLLLGLVRLGQGISVTVLGNMGLSLESIRREVEQQIGPGPDQRVSGAPLYTPRAKKVLALAIKESETLNHEYVGTEHILLGLLREGDGAAPRVLKKLGLDLELLRQNILKELDRTFPRRSEDTAMSHAPKTHAQCELIDISRRYDVYSREGDQDVVYRNALFKVVRTLFKQKEYDVLSEYLELEQADGQIVYIARTSVTKFCEHGQKPDPEIQSGNKE